MSDPIKHFIIPDTQVKPDVPTDHLEAAGNYIAEKRPDVIIHLGDGPDMASLSSYDQGKKSFEGRRYLKDIKAWLDAQERLLKPIRKVRKYKPRMVYCLGNHEARINRAVEADAKLEGVLSLDHLQLRQAGWTMMPFLKPIVIDGVHYAHYFPSGIMGRPCTTARKIISTYHVSAVCGHQQGRDVAYAKRGDGRSLTAIISGSFYQHDEDYLTPLANNCWRGCVMLHEVRDGQFDEMFVSLSYLKRKFGGGR